MKQTMYEIWVRVGQKGGLWAPEGREDGIIESRFEAERLARALVPEVDEVVILEKRVVARIQGTGAGGNGPKT